MTTEERRVQGIYRAVANRALAGVLLCCATTLGMLGAFLLVSQPIAELVVEALPASAPAWLAHALIIVPLAVLLAVVPNLAQLLVIHGRTADAIEAFNAVALREAEDWKAATDSKPPYWRGKARAIEWLAKGEGVGTTARARVAMAAGDFIEAERAVAALPRDTELHQFVAAISEELVRFAETGTADLSSLRQALSLIREGADKDAAILLLGLEEARLAHAAGRDWREPLAEARSRITRPLPAGSTMRERFMSGMRSSVLLYAGIFALAWIVRPWEAL